MSTALPTRTPAAPALPAPRSRVVATLARLEGVRMLRHPALPVGLGLTVYMAASVTDQDWSGARYQGYMAAVGGVVWAVSLAAAAAGRRGRTVVAQDSPVGATERALGRVLGALALVALVAVVVGGAAVWLRATGGLDLGDEPGRTESALYSVPELLQPVALAALAAAIGLAVGSRLRRAAEAVVALSVLWFAVSGLYWVFNSPQLQPLALVQTMPLRTVVGPGWTDPMTFPAHWLLSRPGEYQEGWVRLVVSPEVAAWHDAYLVGLTLLVLGAVVPGRARRWLVVGGGALAAVGVAVQYALLP